MRSPTAFQAAGRADLQAIGFGRVSSLGSYTHLFRCFGRYRRACARMMITSSIILISATETFVENCTNHSLINFSVRLTKKLTGNPEISWNPARNAEILQKTV
jgi:hypothetical protein